MTKPEDNVNLTPQQTRYVVNVLRLQVNDEINVFDGFGKEFKACIVVAERRLVTLRLLSLVEPLVESPLDLHLGQVISKGDRMDYAIQKSVELGVNTITPLYSERCEVKLNPLREEKRIQHWQQIVYSACEQCGRAVCPRVEQPTKLAMWARENKAELKFVLHPQQNSILSSRPISPANLVPNSIAVLIGPEGGLTIEEVQQAAQLDFQPLMLGPRVLRTETAPVVALSWLQQRWGDLRI